MLNGGLYHAIFLLRGLFEFDWTEYFSVSLYPLSINAVLYVAAVFLNIVSEEELLDSRVAMDEGICFSTAGGGFEFMLI